MEREGNSGMTLRQTHVWHSHLVQFINHYLQVTCMLKALVCIESE